MNKSLLLPALAVVTAVSATAGEPTATKLSGACVNQISVDGRYAVSALYGSITIYDLTTGKQWEYTEDMGYYYGIGNGNAMSAVGILVGSQTMDDAAYWLNGEWTSLPVPEEAQFTNSANGITPDGSRICGGIGVSPISATDDVLMMQPAIWERNADGTYADPILLPYPEYDFTGRVPQYVTAVSISDDGKTVAGQVIDCSGMLPWPIVFTQDAAGEWSYRMPHAEMLNPDNAVFPEYPGDGPEYPEAQDFMTDQEKEAYQAAYDAWVESMYQGEYPEPEDYLSEEGKAAYEAAMAAYQTEYQEWETKYEAWAEVFYTCVENAPNLVFNNVRLSATGRYLAQDQMLPDPNAMGWGPGAFLYMPWRFDLSDDSITKYEGASVMSTAMANDGTILGTNGNQDTAYILMDGKMAELTEWMTLNCPEIAAWMDQNMRWDVSDYIWNEETEEYEEVIVEKVSITGVPTCNPDLSIIGTWMANTWDYETIAEGFIFDLGRSYSGVQTVNAAGASDAQTGIYDMQGRRLDSAAQPGLYIVNGRKTVVR